MSPKPSRAASALPTPVARPLPLQIPIQDNPNFDDLKRQVKIFHEEQVVAPEDHSPKNYMLHHQALERKDDIYIFNYDIIGREKSYHYQDYEVVFNATIVDFGNDPAIPCIGGYFYKKNATGEKEQTPFFMTEAEFKTCGFDVGEIIKKNHFEENKETFNEYFRPKKESGSVGLSDFSFAPKKKVLNFCVRDVRVGDERGGAEIKKFVAGYSYSKNTAGGITTKEFAGNAYDFCDLASLRDNFEDVRSVDLARGFLKVAPAEAEPVDFSLANPQNKQAFDVLHHKVKFYGGGGSSKLVEGYYKKNVDPREYTPFLMNKEDYHELIKKINKKTSPAITERQLQDIFKQYNLLEKKEFSEEQKQYFRKRFQEDFQKFRDHAEAHAKKIEELVYHALRRNEKYPDLAQGQLKTKRTILDPFKRRGVNRRIRQQRADLVKEEFEPKDVNGELRTDVHFFKMTNCEGKEFFVYKDGGFYEKSVKDGDVVYTSLNKEKMNELAVFNTLKRYGVSYEKLICSDIYLPDAPRPREEPRAAPAKPTASRLVREERIRPGFGAMVTINSPEKVPGQPGHHKIRIDIDEVFPNSFAKKLGLRGKAEGRPHSIFVFVSGQDFSTEEKIKDFHGQIKQDLTARELPEGKYLTSKLVYDDGENYRVDLRRGGRDFRPQNQNREVSQGGGQGASMA